MESNFLPQSNLIYASIVKCNSLNQQSTSFNHYQNNFQGVSIKKPKLSNVFYLYTL